MTDLSWAEMGEQEAVARRREIALLGDNLWFDHAWYRANNPDLSDATDPVEHFILHGWRDGRDPGPRFSVRWYQAAYPDVPAANLNPLIHFIDHGQAEGRLPHPDAITSPARAVGETVSASVTRPTAREEEDIALVAAHSLFDAAWYLERNPTLVASGMSPAEHFVLCGGFEGRSPGPGFDLLDYLDQFDEVERIGMNAFIHFIRHDQK